MTDCPPAWGDKLLRVRVFTWDDNRNVWDDTMVAVSDRFVFRKGKLWQHNLTLLAAEDSDLAKALRAGKPSLPEGKYLVRVYLDADGKLAKDWKAVLGEDEFVGQVEFAGKWREGYGAMTAVDARGVR